MQQFITDKNFIMPKEILIKLPLSIRQYKDDGVSKNNIDSGNEMYSDCDDCIKQANSLGIPVKKLCPNCNEESVKKEEKKEVEGVDYDILRTHDYVRFQDIENFFPLSKDTITIIFYSGKVLSYKISEKAFLAKISKYITIV